MSIGERAAELTQRYVEGLLSDAEQRELEILLRSQVEAREAYLRELRLHAALCINLKGVRASSVTAAAGAGLSGHGRGRAEVGLQSVRHAPWRWMAIAACLTIVAGGVWWFSQRQGAALGLRVAEVRGQVAGGRVSGTLSRNAGLTSRGQISDLKSQIPVSSAVEGGSHKTLRVGDVLRPGDGIDVGADGYAKLAYPDRTQVELQQNTRLRVTLGAGRGKDAKRLALDGGTLVCSAVPQKLPFEVATRHAVSRIVGTRFSLAVADTKTTLAVLEGKVGLCQGEKVLEVGAGQEAAATDEGMKMQPVKADAAGLEKLSPADSWVRDLLARAEAGPWDALDFGTGVFAKDDWRVDALGGTAERRVWNTQIVSNEASLFVFDKTHWKRGVIVGRMMILPVGKQPATPPSPATATDAAWSTCRLPVQPSLADGGYIYIYQGSIHQGPRDESFGRYYDGVLADRHPRGVWHRVALYFDTQALGAALFMCASWPDDRADPPPVSAWNVKHGLMLFMSDDLMEIRFGIAAKGVLLSVQGLKLVPLGADMPPPPGWGGEVKGKVNSNQ